MSDTANFSAPDVALAFVQSQIKAGANAPQTVSQLIAKIKDKFKVNNVQAVAVMDWLACSKRITICGARVFSYF